MVRFEAKMKINDVDYLVTCSENNKLCISDELESVLTSDELVRLLNILKTLIFWMGTAAKKEVNVKRID